VQPKPHTPKNAATPLAPHKFNSSQEHVKNGACIFTKIKTHLL